MNDKELFKVVLNRFAEQYPHRDIRLEEVSCGSVVYIDGELRFNTEGFNLLYNIKRLCDFLEKELR